MATGCGGSDREPPREVTPFPGTHDTATLSGSGSTFAEPLIREWTERYRRVAPGVSVEYEGVGSAAAVDRLLEGRGDFVTSDVPLTEVEEADVGGSQAVAQLPWVAGAIALPYNLPELDGDLRLSPEVLSAIFAGRIDRWDDPDIREDNPDVRLPSLPIQVVHRSDRSGTTAVLTSYLRAAASWDLPTGTGARVPAGTGAGGSQGVVDAVKRTTGALGYVQLSYAQRASLPVALLGNRAGRFVAPTADAVGTALASAGRRKYGTTVELRFTPDAPGAYPLATLSYLVYRREGLERG